MERITADSVNPSNSFVVANHNRVWHGWCQCDGHSVTKQRSDVAFHNWSRYNYDEPLARIKLNDQCSEVVAITSDGKIIFIPRYVSIIERKEVDSSAASLGLIVSEFRSSSITLLKPAGGKIIATRTGNSYSVYGITFNAVTINDSFYWAIQFAAHCK